MGEINNQSQIMQQRTLAFNKSKPPVGGDVKTQRLDSLPGEKKGQLSNAAKVALKDPSSSEAEAFNNSGLTRDNVINIADGKISEVGPLPSADVNNLVAVAEKTQSKAEKDTDPVIMGKATDITNEQPKDGIRGQDELNMADDAWMAFGNAVQEDPIGEKGLVATTNNENIVSDAIIKEQPGIDIGTDVVALGEAEVNKNQLKPGAGNLVLNEVNKFICPILIAFL